MTWNWPKGRKFVRGHRPWNWRPLNSERITERGIMVKIVGPRTWRLKHHLVWEAAHGPLPKGCKLAFLDGDKTNCSLSNLQLIQRHQAGSEKVGGDGFLHVLLPGSNKWRQKQLVVWEATHGPVPPGFILIFADGNSHNCALDNLVMVPRNLKKRRLNNLVGEKVLPLQEELNNLADTWTRINATLLARLFNLDSLHIQATSNVPDRL